MTRYSELKPVGVDRAWNEMIDELKKDYEHSDEDRRLELAEWLKEAIKNPPDEDGDFWGTEGFRPWRDEDWND
jgi:hypothetical protein